LPTARELLEQADALMRRNRALADAEAAASRSATEDEDVPELTETVEPAPRAPAAGSGPGTASPASAYRAIASLDDVPELTDAVEEIEAPSILEPTEDDDLSRWLEIDRGEKSVTGPAPDSIVVVPAATRPEAAPVAVAASAPMGDALAAMPPESVPIASETAMPPVSVPDAQETAVPVVEPLAEFLLEDAPADAVVEIDIGVPGAAADEGWSAARGLPDEPPLVAALPPAVFPPAESAPAGTDDTRWATLAEDIRMQVLQRLDIFTDSGLQGELTTRLQPIVDRASAELVAAINQHVGQILRSYVAEAIEREIEKWRQGG
jgi:hypothetical protein